MGLGFPETALMIDIALWGHVKVEWLITGRGPKRGNFVDTRDLILGELIRRLSADTRREVINYLEYQLHRDAPPVAEEALARYLPALESMKRE